MARVRRNFKRIVHLLLLKLLREGVTFLLHLGALRLVVGLFVDRWAEGASSLSDEKSDEENKRGRFHRAQRYRALEVPQCDHGRSR